MKEEMINSLTEKYRPCKIEEMVGQSHITMKILEYRKHDNLPHLLFYGRAGRGKTTLALLISDLFNCDFLELNASDKRGIDTVRERIRTFARYKPFMADFKLLLLDEADSMTQEAQNMLRRIMEKYARNCRFIICCNDLNKIIEPIQSRCTRFKFSDIPEREIFERLRFINSMEKRGLCNSDIEEISRKCHGDLRRGINDLQGYTSKPKNEYDEIFMR